MKIIGSVTVVTPLPAVVPAVPVIVVPLAFSCTVRALAMHPKNMSKIPSLFQSPFSVEWMISLISAGGRDFTPIILARRLGVTSGKTRLSNDVTWRKNQNTAIITKRAGALKQNQIKAFFFTSYFSKKDWTYFLYLNHTCKKFCKISIFLWRVY